MTHAAPSDNLTLRPARLDDLARIGEMERRVWRELAAPYEELRRRFRLFPQGLVVATAAAELLGFCCGLLTDQDATGVSLDETFPPRHVPKGTYFFIYGLTVDPVFRRKGIGSRLIAEELDVARKQACRTVQLVANQFSGPLIEKAGFRVVRIMPELFTAHPDLMPDPVLMERKLNDH